MNEPEQPIRIRLSRLRADEAELVRIWRNSPDVQRHMAYREPITPQQQQRWFESINNDRNYYFLIRQDEKPIGLVNLKDVDREKAVAESGIFFGETEGQQRGLVAYAVVFAVMDFAFGSLGLRELRARVLAENERAIRYNLALGYQMLPGQQGEPNPLYAVSRERYESVTQSARDALRDRINVAIEI